MKVFAPSESERNSSHSNPHENKEFLPKSGNKRKDLRVGEKHLIILGVIVGVLTVIAVALIYWRTSVAMLNYGSRKCPDYDSHGGLHLAFLSYNIYQVPKAEDSARRLSRLIPALKEVDGRFGLRPPDILLFQEVLFSRTAANLRKGLEDEYPYFAVQKGCTRWRFFGGGQTCNAIASKFPIDDWQTLVGGWTPVVYAKINVKQHQNSTDKFIHVINLHFISGNKTEKRIKDYEFIKTWMEKNGIPKDEPVIVGGDFNDAAPHSWDNLGHNDIESMPAWRLAYDHRRTGRVVDGVYHPGSWTQRSNWIVAMQRRYNYTAKSYPWRYARVIDYVTYDADHRRPTEPVSSMRVLPLKSSNPYSFLCDHSWCRRKPMRGLYSNGLWFFDFANIPTSVDEVFAGRLFEGAFEKLDDDYDDLSDHFPVYQQFSFQLE